MTELAVVHNPTVIDFPLTDFGNAERLVALHGANIRYVPGQGWYAWDGRRWKRDTDGALMRFAKHTVRSLYAAAGKIDDPADRKRLIKWALDAESEARLRAAIRLAETERQVVVDAAQLNQDPLLFNAANGTIDLRNGVLREHRREDLLTRITPVAYDPHARSELWEASVRRATGGDAELERFFQRAVGYSLSGDTSEDKLFFAHGPTATAKSSLLEAIRAALGEYAMTADFETFLKRKGDAGIRNDVARLDGARIVISIEVDEGKALAQGLIKTLTGGDTVAARFLYRETFEFRPVFKLWLVANERPRANADDDALWRRIIQVPFTQVIPEGERDERVKLELRTSPEVFAAILAWAVEGCIDWQMDGLAVPDSVREYTSQYRAENDPLREWIADCCDTGPNLHAAVADLRHSYEQWAATNGEHPIGSKTFAAKLQARGYTTDRLPSGARIRRGIAPRSENQ
jgi:putative DNA primase/helicase